MSWHLYVLRTRAGILYTGITTDLDRRLQQHESGKGARNLRGKGPLTLEYSCETPDRSCAQRLEARVKKLSRRQKEALIAGTFTLDEVPVSAELPDTP